MDSPSRRAASISVTLPLFGLLLAGCFKEDPELQMMQAELQLTRQLLEQAKREGSADRPGPQDKEANTRYPGLREENEELERKLALAAQELEKAKASSFRVLEENELFASLERSAAPLHEKVEADYRIDSAGVKELQLPDLSKSPYSCILFLEVTRRSDNRPLEAAIPVKADWQGRWTFPEMPDLFNSLKPRGSYGRLPVAVSGGDARPASTQATTNASGTVSGRAGSTATTLNTSSDSNSGASRSSPPPLFRMRFTRNASIGETNSQSFDSIESAVGKPAIFFRDDQSKHGFLIGG